jgi:tetratricopeptide (TPR) repeat protein
MSGALTGREAPVPRPLRWSTVVLVAAAAALPYLPALGNGFVWDDRLILDHQLTRLSGLRAAFFPPADLPLAGGFYYRPLVFASYLLDQRLGGGPLAFHLTPVVLHVVATVLLLVLVVRLLGASVGVTVAAVLFAVHPVHAEVVAWMAGRAESLAAVGVLGALLAWGRWLDEGRAPWLGVGALALLAGLLGKETALAGAFLAGTLPWVLPRRSATGRRTALWAAIAAAVVAYVLLRAAAHGLTVGAAGATDPGAAIQNLLAALGFYARALVWPHSAGAVLTAVPHGRGAVAAGLAAFVAVVVAVIAALRRRQRLAAWALAWTVVALVPALVLVVRTISETPVAERYLYLPSAGATVLVAWLLVMLPARTASAAVALSIALALLGGAVSAARSTLWREEVEFWRNAIAVAPDEGVAYMKLAGALVERGDVAGTEAAYRGALGARLTPDQRAHAANNLAQLLVIRGALDEAEPILSDVLRSGTPPARARAAYLRGHAYLVRGARDEAAHWFRAAIETDPASATAAEARGALARLGLPPAPAQGKP